MGKASLFKWHLCFLLSCLSLQIVGNPRIKVRGEAERRNFRTLALQRKQGYSVSDCTVNSWRGTLANAFRHFGGGQSLRSPHLLFGF